MCNYYFILLYTKCIGGVFGEQLANEYCFTLTNTTIKALAKSDTKYAAALYIYNIAS